MPSSWTSLGWRLGAVLIAAVWGGCYASHQLDSPDDRLDAAPRDGAVLDGGPVDAFTRDVGLDGDGATTEGGVECRSRWQLGDARHWPARGDEGAPWGNHVTGLPILVPGDDGSLLAFVTHGALVNTGEADARRGTCPIGPGCIPDEPASWDRPGVIQIVRASDGALVRSIPDSGEGSVGATSGLAAADLDGDGVLDVVGFGARSGALAWSIDGRMLWSAEVPAFGDIFMDDIDGAVGRPRSLSGSPLVVDLEGDGRLEVALGYGVVDAATGALRWRASAHRGINSVYGPLVCAVDLDADGVLEILAGGSAYRSDGSLLWQAPIRSDGFCGVSRTGALRVAVVSSGTLYLLEPTTGRVTWSRPLHGATRIGITGPAGGRPLFVDVDGDGGDEILVASEGQLALYDPLCTDTTPECIADGMRWTLGIDDAFSGVTSASVADLDGDSALEVIHADATTLRIADARTGRLHATAHRRGRTRTEYPLVVDLDHDDRAEIVTGISNEWRHLRIHPSGGPDEGIGVYRPQCATWVSAPREWPQYEPTGATTLPLSAVPGS